MQCNYYLDYMNFDDNKLIFRYFGCKANYNRDFNNELIDRFSNTYDFCNNEINKFMLLLRKGVYPFEYMDSWERFKEKLLPDKESFYSNLNMENIADIDYRHAKHVFKKFNKKNLGDYHNLYVQSDTLLLAVVFTSFRNLCFDVYGLDPAHFLSGSGLTWQTCLKNLVLSWN